MQVYCIYSIKHNIKSSIVNVGSIVGENGFTELAGYSSTKELKSLTKSVAVEHTKDNIRANIVILDLLKHHILKNLKKIKENCIIGQ